MAKPPASNVLDELRKIDTPTITNVVATYPKNPLCLGIYNPWTENWYTDTSIRCIYPEFGAVIGHAVTCVYGLPDPNYAGRLSFMDVVDALDAMPKPTILVIHQKWPPEIMAKAGARRRDHDHHDDGGRMCRVAVERSIARCRCDPSAEVPDAAWRGHCWPWRDGGARG